MANVEQFLFTLTLKSFTRCFPAISLYLPEGAKIKHFLFSLVFMVCYGFSLLFFCLFLCLLQKYMGLFRGFFLMNSRPFLDFRGALQLFFPDAIAGTSTNEVRAAATGAFFYSCPLFAPALFLTSSLFQLSFCYQWLRSSFPPVS